MTDIDLGPLTAAKVDRVTGDNLIAGPRTITISSVEGEVYEGKQIASLGFAGDDGMPYKPCKTMLRLIAAVWGPRTSQWVGKSMTLYRDPSVTFGALATGGVRISHMSHMERDAEVILTLKKGKKGVVKVKPLATAKAAPKAPAPVAPVVHRDDVGNEIDPRLATLYAIKAALNAATSTAALEAISADNLAHYEAMTAEQQAEINEVYGERWTELQGG